MMAAAGKVLGIVAGGGDLPLEIAASAREAGRAVFVLGLEGCADAWVDGFPHAWASLGEAGKIARALHGADCGDMLMAGKLQRPEFSKLKLDAKGMMMVPRLIAAAARGDDALLRAVADMFAREGFTVVSVADAAPGLLAPEGKLGAVAPSGETESDIARAFAIVRAMGEFDVGQAAAVCEGLPLAVEAAEGTDEMIARIGTLPEHFRGTVKKRRGVLVKAVKPVQDGKTDLPVIGLATLNNAAAVGLAGIAIEAGRTLILNRGEVIAEADRLGMFVVGVKP
jgi:UDP-2,3-diacylglucosamine hydrolase